MQTLKNITRYTYEFTAFQGWRLTVCRKGRVFTHYFSDLTYGSEEAALEATLKAREVLNACLLEHPTPPENAYAECKQYLHDAAPAAQAA